MLLSDITIQIRNEKRKIRQLLTTISREKSKRRQLCKLREDSKKLQHQLHQLQELCQASQVCPKQYDY
jgi:hypothetical protein